jgi:hemin uptake protein HemP
MNPAEQQPQDDSPVVPALPATAGKESVRRILSEELFAGERVVLIQHAGEEYRLLITRNDRLILQK